MNKIAVTSIDGATFDVTVEGPTTTAHRVMADPAYVARLTQGRVPSAILIERSFEFLLDREPNTSILRQFDLRDIARYFPEYERKIMTLFQQD